MCAAYSMDYDYLVKVVTIGDSGVGKTCLLHRWTENRWDEAFISTIGVDFAIKTFDHNGKRTKLQIWDTAGQERFRNICASYYRGANLVLLVFDVTDMESFMHIERWLSDIYQHVSESVPVLLVANKTDLKNKRVVSEERINELSSKLNLPVVEASAKSAKNVDKVFTDAVDLYLARRAAMQREQEEASKPVVLHSQTLTSWSCCGVS